MVANTPDHGQSGSGGVGVGVGVIPADAAGVGAGVGADVGEMEMGKSVGSVGVGPGQDGVQPDLLACPISVQIWDVRRSWVPKWCLPGADESVTGMPVIHCPLFPKSIDRPLPIIDLAFGDPDVVWAQHSSGTFSQIDLRDCTKLLDVVPSKAVTWEASGSLAFVARRKEDPWQIPYDDV